MRKCPNCGCIIDNDNAKYCKKCGAKLENANIVQDSESLNTNVDSSSIDVGNRLETESNNGIILGVNTNEENNKSHQENDNEETMIKGTTISFMGVIKKCFCNYVNFSGRANRKEFWYFYLFNLIIYLVVYFLLFAVSNEALILTFASIAIVYGLGTILPNIAVAVRRLHDIGKSGWWYLLFLIPYIGSIILIVFFCMKSDQNENKYGKPC